MARASPSSSAAGGRAADSPASTRSAKARRHPMLRFLKWNVILITLLALALVGLRIALPGIVQRYVNRTLDEMPEYDGRIGDVDIQLIAGAYEVESIEIVKTTGDIPVPFFEAKVVKFSVEWRALLEGAWVGEIEFFSPVMNFVNGKRDATTQVGVDKPWLDVITKLFPLELNRFEVNDGTIYYRDFGSSPKVDLTIDRIHMLGRNFTNSRDLSESLVATVEATGRGFGSGDMELAMQIDPFSHDPTFDLDFKMSPVPLVKFNDFAQAYANFDFEKGALQLAAELAAKEGAMHGYVKPLFDNVQVVDIKEDSKNPAKLLWEGLVGGVTKLFRNQPRERFATKVPIQGRVDNPKAALLPMIGNIFRNAFIEAYRGDIENLVELDQKSEG